VSPPTRAAIRGLADGKGSGVGGEFVRGATSFHDWIEADGSGDFPAEPGRYHLYISYACPWASRAMMVRRLKGLEDVVSMSVVDPVRDGRGWAFPDNQLEGPDVAGGLPGPGPDPVNGFDFLAEAYHQAAPEFSGHVSVPVLWDKRTGTIVNNESAEVVRILNAEFDEWAAHPDVDLYPEELRDRIDDLNDRIYSTVNNGVYKAGFARSQEAYEAAFDELFASLDWLEGILADSRYLTGDAITEADWRLFTTLVRFDAVYHNHFRCNLRKLVQYPNLWAYARDLHSQPGIAATVVMGDIKRHYYKTHPSLNPLRIVPKGPETDWSLPHGREGLSGS